MRRALLACVLTVTAATGLPAQRGVALTNDQVRAEFGARGLSALSAFGHTIQIAQDEFSVSIDGRTFASRALAPPARTSASGRVTYTWTADAYKVEAAYELQPEWAFVSKQLSIVARAGSTYRVDDVQMFDMRLGESVQAVYVPGSVRRTLGTGDYGGAIRLGGGRGLLALVQNPFLAFAREGDAFSIRYKPDMDWREGQGPFMADRGILTPYRMTGRFVPERMIPEWRVEAPEPIGPGMDEGEDRRFHGPSSAASCSTSRRSRST